VALRLARYTTGPNLIVAALLHDTIEDTPYTLQAIAREFGTDVAEMVDFLTEDKSITDWAERKQKAIEKAAQNRTTLALKAFDALSNMHDLYQNLAQYGDSFWENFHAPKEMELRYFQIILEKAKDELPTDVVVDYVSVLKDLEHANTNIPLIELGMKTA
ncbi:MAG: HD domain-containing protein, partial [bacterium]|nr:HD domain-containing protein [bacterium]